jgi:hypothetical protein
MGHVLENERKHVPVLARGGETRARVTRYQDKDLGGFGKASGATPGNGGMRGIAKVSEMDASGTEAISGARAAPQQVMPKLQQQQWAQFSD